jgi:hypothetical protein
MTKGCLVAVAGVVGFWCGLEAQQTNAATGFDSLHDASSYTPPLTLADARKFPFRSEFAWMEAPNNFLPDWRPAGWESNADLNTSSNASRRRQKIDSKSVASYSKDSSTQSVELRKSLWENVHGEVGFLYGRSTGGRVSQDVEAGYISATVGDDKVSISVGASYENSNLDFKRRGR